VTMLMAQNFDLQTMSIYSVRHVLLQVRAYSSSHDVSISKRTRFPFHNHTTLLRSSEASSFLHLQNIIVSVNNDVVLENLNFCLHALNLTGEIFFLEYTRELWRIIV
jgi:hypothetical protein